MVDEVFENSIPNPDNTTLMETEANSWNTFGLRFEAKDSCPLPPTHIDLRFFSSRGEPTEELKKRGNLAFKAANEVLADPNVDIYVVGGVVAKRDKNDYEGS